MDTMEKVQKQQPDMYAGSQKKNHAEEWNPFENKRLNPEVWSDDFCKFPGLKKVLPWPLYPLTIILIQQKFATTLYIFMNMAD